MPKSEDIVEEARNWIGTPYVHGQQLVGIGVDCAGLILGVGAHLGIFGEDLEERFKPFRGYGRIPNPRLMQRFMAEFLRPAGLSTPEQGMIGWFCWRGVTPLHLAIIGKYDGRLTMIHANGIVGKCVEHSLDRNWLARLDSVWAYPGIEI